MTTGENNDFQRTALERTRERIFTEYGIRYTGVWLLPEYFRGALAILKLGIISGDELIGSSGKKYHIDLRDSLGNPEIEKIDYLLFDLVRTGLDEDLFLLHSDILRALDESFERIVEIVRVAQAGLVLEGHIKDVWDECRYKVSVRVIEGKVPPLWRHVILTGKKPLSLGRRLSEIFLSYVPQASAIDIAAWANSLIMALDREPEKFNTLRVYVGKRKKDLMQAPKGPISITE